jgi:hypothetical protein
MNKKKIPKTCLRKKKTDGGKKGSNETEGDAYQFDRMCRVFNGEGEFLVPFRIGILFYHPRPQLLRNVEKIITVSTRARIRERRRATKTGELLIRENEIRQISWSGKIIQGNSENLSSKEHGSEQA